MAVVAVPVNHYAGPFSLPLPVNRAPFLKALLYVLVVMSNADESIVSSVVNFVADEEVDVGQGVLTITSTHLAFAADAAPATHGAVGLAWSVPFSDVVLHAKAPPTSGGPSSSLYVQLDTAVAVVRNANGDTESCWECRFVPVEDASDLAAKLVDTWFDACNVAALNVPVDECEGACAQWAEDSLGQKRERVE